MTPEQEAQFYATILAGVIANKDIGGETLDKVHVAMRYGYILLEELKLWRATTLPGTPIILKD